MGTASKRCFLPVLPNPTVGEERSCYVYGSFWVQIRWKRPAALSAVLGEFAKLRKATICFVTFVRLSVCPSNRPRRKTRLPLEEFSRHLTFKYIWKKSVEKIQVSWKSDSNNRYFTWRPTYIYDHNSLNSSRIKNDSEKNVEKIENQNLHFIFNKFLPKIVPFVRKGRKIS